MAYSNNFRKFIWIKLHSFYYISTTWVGANTHKKNQSNIIRIVREKGKNKAMGYIFVNWGDFLTLWLSSDHQWHKLVTIRSWKFLTLRSCRFEESILYSYRFVTIHFPINQQAMTSVDKINCMIDLERSIGSDSIGNPCNEQSWDFNFCLWL